LGGAQDPFAQDEEDDIVWGIAYLIDPPREAEVRAYLGELFVSGLVSMIIQLLNLITLLFDPDHREKVRC
jgi:hypothetical protein